MKIHPKTLNFVKLAQVYIVTLRKFVMTPHSKFPEHAIKNLSECSLSVKLGQVYIVTLHKFVMTPHSKFPKHAIKNRSECSLSGFFEAPRYPSRCASVRARVANGARGRHLAKRL